MEADIRQRFETLERRIAAIEDAVGMAIGMAQDLQREAIRSYEILSARLAQLSATQGEVALLEFEVHALMAAAPQATRQRAAVNATLYLEENELDTYATDPEHWVGFRRKCDQHLPEVQLPPPPAG